MNLEQQSQPTALIGDDKVLVVIKRHPFGLVALYLQAVVGLVVAIGLMWFLIPTLLGEESTAQAQQWVLLLGIFASTVTAFLLLIATSIYRRNQWLVTSDSIQQLQQSSLFHRQISELAIANIEDITVQQNGLLADLLGFGTLEVETAGAGSDFKFNYCPTPEKYAVLIQQAKEHHLEKKSA